MGDLRYWDIRDFAAKYDLKTMVETGTFKGDAVQYALDSGYSRVHSVEIMPELFRQCEARFQGNPAVTIHCDRSDWMLEKVLPTIQTNALFWLDAHFPGADAGLKRYTDEKDEEVKNPLENELRLIKRLHGQFQDVILIDDLWLYEDGEYEWGRLEDHIRRHGQGQVRSDLCRGSLEFVPQLFPDHYIARSKAHQGYLLLTPHGH